MDDIVPQDDNHPGSSSLGGSGDCIVTAGSVSFDDHGDLTLLVGSNRQPFLVCSRALSRASRVFNAMLYGSFRESRPAFKTTNEPWIIELLEDDPSAAQHVLSIVHANFSRVPKALSLTELHSLLVFTEKYDMTASIHPWVQGCTPSDKVLKGKNYFEIIGVAWELGISDILDRVGQRLILETRADQQGNLVYPPDSGLGQGNMALIPIGFLENIADGRRALLEMIFGRLRVIVSDLRTLVSLPESGDLWVAKEDYCARGDVACVATSYGAIMAAMGQAEMKILVESKEVYVGLLSTYEPAVIDVIEMLGAIPIQLNKLCQKRRPGAKCSPIPKLREDVDRLVKSQKSALTLEHMARMEAQRAKLGVEWGQLKSKRRLFGGQDGEDSGDQEAGDSDVDMEPSWW